jgi:4'-phosphopantetheinyl transferase
MFGSETVAPSRNASVREDEVHIWCITIDRRAHELRAWRRVLSDDECARMDRFQFEADRRRYLVGRAVLRTLLGRRLGIGPGAVRFSYSAYEQPLLAADLAASRLQFSVSHSGELVLVALTQGRAVGVDVERIRTDLAVDKIATRFFSPRERDILAAVPATRQHDAFFACWTRKEAYIKARGDGLNLPLDAFDVDFLPGQPVRLAETRHDPGEAARWTLHDLDIGEGYKAALALEGEGTPTCWQWPVDSPGRANPPPRWKIWRNFRRTAPRTRRRSRAL